jgi:hypothetical protein
MVEDIHTAISTVKQNRLATPIRTILPSDSLLDSYEDDLGRKFPCDLLLVLREVGDSICNGIELLKLTQLRNSPNELAVVAREAWALGVPQGWLPFCEDSSDYYCVTPGGEVRFWSHDGPSGEKWSNMSDWIMRVWVGGG